MDYNLLLIARVKEELHAGLHTGLIRALGGTGGVVTSAGLVFAFTMLAMLISDLRTIGQLGSTVCIGLLLDTLVVRSFVVPAIVTILGKWFWWPTLVRSPGATAIRTDRSTAMNWNLWNYLTAITFALALVFATCASIYVGRVLRQKPVPLTNEINSVPTVLGKLRKRVALEDYEKPLANQIVDARRPLMAFSIPAAFFTVRCSTSSAASSTCTAPSRPSGPTSGSSR